MTYIVSSGVLNSTLLAHSLNSKWPQLTSSSLGSVMVVSPQLAPSSLGLVRVVRPQLTPSSLVFITYSVRVVSLHLAPSSLGSVRVVRPQLTPSSLGSVMVVSPQLAPSSLGSVRVVRPQLTPSSLGFWAIRHTARPATGRCQAGENTVSGSSWPLSPSRLTCPPDPGNSEQHRNIYRVRQKRILLFHCFHCLPPR